MESIHASMYKAGLVRSTSDKWLGGICGGIAGKVGVDVNAVRLLMFIFVMAAGSGLLLYVLAWIAMPDDTYRPAAIDGGSVNPTIDGPQDTIPPHN